MRPSVSGRISNFVRHWRPNPKIFTNRLRPSEKEGIAKELRNGGHGSKSIAVFLESVDKDLEKQAADQQFVANTSAEPLILVGPDPQKSVEWEWPASLDSHDLVPISGESSMPIRSLEGRVSLTLAPTLLGKGHILGKTLPKVETNPDDICKKLVDLANSEDLEETWQERERRRECVSPSLRPSVAESIVDDAFERREDTRETKRDQSRERKELSEADEKKDHKKKKKEKKEKKDKKHKKKDKDQKSLSCSKSTSHSSAYSDDESSQEDEEKKEKKQKKHKKKDKAENSLAYSKSTSHSSAHSDDESNQEDEEKKEKKHKKHKKKDK